MLRDTPSVFADLWRVGRPDLAAAVRDLLGTVSLRLGTFARVSKLGAFAIQSRPWSVSAVILPQISSICRRCAMAVTRCEKASATLVVEGRVFLSLSHRDACFLFLLLLCDAPDLGRAIPQLKRAFDYYAASTSHNCIP